MPSISELLRQGKSQQVWEEYCGFLDLSVADYMAIQRGLLEEQLAVFGSSGIGRALWRGGSPKTLDEFRAGAPFTTYRDYAPYLLERNESALPEKPFAWCHTSGRSGEYEFKWVPLTRRMYDKVGEAALGSFILSAAGKRGDVILKDGMTFPYTIAPPPYITGLGAERLLELFPFRVLPSLEESAGMGFMERIRKAFALALDEGMDFFFGVTSIMLKIGEQFGKLGGKGGPKLALGPRGMLRLLRAFVRSAFRGRPIQPRDIWKVKGVLCGGMDTSILKRRVAELWGVEPLEAFVATEFGGVATQAWNRAGLTFFPRTNFWEFISERDYRRLLAEPDFIPPSCLMDEVRPQVEYVLVGTNFYGGALARYIIGDMVKFTSLEDGETGVRLPQMSFVSRIDGLIDVGGLTRLTEKTIWQAIEDSGLPYEDWTIRKEYEGDRPILRLYIEIKGPAGTEAGIAEAVHRELKALDAPYRELETLAGLKPLRATRLSRGTFSRYAEERQAAGADLAQLKPPHVNATDKALEGLLRMSRWRM